MLTQKYDLFPTRIWHIEGTPQLLVDELYHAAYKIKEKYLEGENKSNKGGYHSPFFAWDTFHPEGKKLINEIIDKNIKKPFKVNEWWYNISETGHWNMPHTHPGVDLSLVLYLTETDELLNFFNPFSQRKTVAMDGTTLYSPKTKKGDILIFPSDIQHFVMPNQREEDRISISMNLQLC
jgi:uncharacterized protein (TIGR02466 family)